MARFVTGITVKRRLVAVPLVEDVAGCVVNPRGCCDGEPGDPCADVAECVTTCAACASLAGSWTFTAGADDVTVCHLADPADGNACRWVSADLAWEMRLVTVEGVSIWQLTNRDTGAFYFLDADDWDCHGANTLEDIDGGEPVVITPAATCVSWNCGSGGCVEVAGTGGTYPTLEGCEAVCTSWNCVDGTCEEVAGSGGTYATEAECIAALCGAIIIANCDNVPIPATITLTISGGTPADGTYSLTFDSGIGNWVGTAPGYTFWAECAEGNNWQITIFNPIPRVYIDGSSTLSPVSATFDISTFSPGGMATLS